ncbi:hypothetical protein CCACVL1_03368 [Corchorus capsularis]|uniref:Uncharacterized protein n=1 Tax=Corchorus capsularis TaxID=210143 RepID=A0A1R3JZT4_COCAP|nr:hypothetical protein CCACVL1_03368 [Corchorus capsularis]
MVSISLSKDSSFFKQERPAKAKSERPLEANLVVASIFSTKP